MSQQVEHVFTTVSDVVLTEKTYISCSDFWKAKYEIKIQWLNFGSGLTERKLEHL
jgi:hypothetical protein